MCVTFRNCTIMRTATQYIPIKEGMFINNASRRARFIIPNKGTITTNKEVRKEQKQTLERVKRAVSFEGDVITITIWRRSVRVSTCD